MSTETEIEARRTRLLAFMNDAPDGKYEVNEPTDEQLAAVLPWLINGAIVWGRKVGYCNYVHNSLHAILGTLKCDEDGEIEDEDGVLRFVAADGRDCNGYDKDGFDGNGFDQSGRDKDGYNALGYNRDGYNKDGYNRRGFDKDGFNANGLDQYGQTREQVVAKLVGSWTPAHLQLVAAKLAQRQATAVKTADNTTVEPEQEPAEELATTAA
jgi:hypothetical protein